MRIVHIGKAAVIIHRDRICIVLVNMSGHGFGRAARQFRQTAAGIEGLAHTFDVRDEFPKIQADGFIFPRRAAFQVQIDFCAVIRFRIESDPRPFGRAIGKSQIDNAIFLQGFIDMGRIRIAVHFGPRRGGIRQGRIHIEIDRAAAHRVNRRRSRPFVITDGGDAACDQRAAFHIDRAALGLNPGPVDRHIQASIDRECPGVYRFQPDGISFFIVIGHTVTAVFREIHATIDREISFGIKRSVILTLIR